MSTPVEQAKVWAAELSAAGIRATHDPRKIAPPCVLIVPPSVELDSNCGGTGEWTAFALAATVGTSDAWEQLDQIVLKALPILPVERIEPNSYSAEETVQYPAFTMTWTETVEWSA